MALLTLTCSLLPKLFIYCLRRNKLLTANVIARLECCSRNESQGKILGKHFCGVRL